MKHKQMDVISMLGHFYEVQVCVMEYHKLGKQ